MNICFKEERGTKQKKKEQEKRGKTRHNESGKSGKGIPKHNTEKKQAFDKSHSSYKIIMSYNATVCHLM